MDQIKLNEPSNLSQTGAAPQLRVRTNLRGGESVEACQTNLEYWQNDYYNQYNKAKQTKYFPCPTTY